MSRFFKSAAFPILIVVVLAFFAQKLIGSSSHTQNYTFGDMLTQLDNNQFRVMTLDQKANSADGHAGERRQVLGRLPGLVRPDADPRRAGRRSSRRVNVQSKSTNGWLSLLTYILPFVIFIGFWIFLMNQVQGGGSKVMSFGKSRAKRMSVDSPEDHLPGCRRGRRGGRGAARDQGVPREPEEIPGARRANPEGRAAVRPAGHRQDAAGARGRRRGRRAVLLDLAARTSSRCSSASAPRACVTCSSRPSRTPRASSSWTRSTPSAATAAPGSAAATTSASRRSTSCSSRWTASR